jgi:BRCT domain type II-containing protein
MTNPRPMSLAPRRVLLATVALLALAVGAPAASALAATSSSPASQAARAAATPIIPPPKKPPKPFTCSVSKKHKHCAKSKRACKTNAHTHTKTCIVTVVRCTLAGKIKRCTTTVQRCTTSTRKTKKHKKPKTTCKTTSVKHTSVRAAAVDTAASVPRFEVKHTSARAGVPRADDVSLVSSTTGSRAAPAAVLDEPGSQSSTGRAGAGVGALILVFALLWLYRGRREARRTRP